MLGSHSVFSHQHPLGYGPSEWAQTHHQQQTPHPQQHPQAQAMQAATVAAQHQHYNRIAANNNTVVPGISGMASSEHNQSVGDQTLNDENRRVLDWIAQLLKQSTREQALLELSKKREQVQELALILWHSYGIVCHVS
jgi:CCR4-NOT transcription complex subunit 9